MNRFFGDSYKFRFIWQPWLAAAFFPRVSFIRLLARLARKRRSVGTRERAERHVKARQSVSRRFSARRFSARRDCTAWSDHHHHQQSHRLPHHPHPLSAWGKGAGCAPHTDTPVRPCLILSARAVELHCNGPQCDNVMLFQCFLLNYYCKY